jgi:hypothetical protein
VSAECDALLADLDGFLYQWRTVGAIPWELSRLLDRHRPAAPDRQESIACDGSGVLEVDQ